MPGKFELRKYQTDAIEKLRASIRKGNRRIILQAATGSGKTIIAAEIVDNALQKGKKVIFLVHFRQLAFQAMERFTEYGLGDEVGYIMAGEETHLNRPVQIISVQTYERRLKLEKLDINPWFKKADLVIYDECHSSISRTRKAILDLYAEDAIILGLSATPARADGKPLNAIYEDIVECISIKELIDKKFLVPAVYYGAKELPDLENIPTVAGDYNQKVLGERVNKPKLVGDILENFLRIAGDRQGVIFATNVAHSHYIKTTFENHGISIEHIDAKTPEDERQEILRAFKNGDIQVVTNCNIFSEGADFGWASVVVLAKPSKSLPRYFQMAGRGIRPWPGKEDCIIIDHSGIVNQHGFIDDPIEWRLTGKAKAWRKKKAKKKEKPLFECEMCLFMHRQEQCPNCGWRIKHYGKKVEAYEAELKELKKPKAKKTYTMEEKRKWYGMLETERIAKGYKPGWTANQYRSRFGVWPKGMDGIVPCQQNKEFNNWLTYQRIKYFKSKKAQAA